MSAIGALGKFTLRGILVALGIGLGAMGGVCIVLNVGLARWPGHAAEVRVALSEPPWLNDAARAVPGGVAPRSAEAMVAAIGRADLVQRWAEVILCAQVEHHGALIGFADDRDAIATALASALLSGPLLIDGAVALRVGGFRSDAEARLAAASGGEALAGLISDLRHEEILALREVIAQHAASAPDTLGAILVNAHEAHDFAVTAVTVTPARVQPASMLYFGTALGACGGLLLMLAALRPRAGFASQLNELASISRALGVEVIGAVPRTRSLEQRGGTMDTPQLLDAHGDVAALEAFEVLLTNFRFAAPRSEIRRVCFLSVVPGEGCSTVALNFAAAHARRGLHVGYVRRHGQAQLADPMLSNLSIIDEPGTGAGHELDLYVIAGPAVLADPDARGLAAKSDAVVLVMDTTVTGRELALRALALLRTAQAPLAGLVLNRVRRGGLRRAFAARAEGRRLDHVSLG